ncbi:membrane-associated protein, putative [Bodo saltans]|uniref:Membrane-associated protein, putative n=1 Tax=Bodo saltans TaxID=75058 RepID=A0A0S4JAM8_BODSA|nr:membrane-associated protein, putative [Bodo saltans]|eukprot:CUG87180.1 membrane-associated protein, putative [Bodo saltans]
MMCAPCDSVSRAAQEVVSHREVRWLLLFPSSTVPHQCRRRSLSALIPPSSLALNVLVVVIALLFPPSVEAGCQSYDCPVPTCVEYTGNGDLMANSRARGVAQVLGTTGGLSTQSYNDSRLGKLATVVVASGSVKASSSSCSQGSLIVPPYDEDMYNLLVSKGACFWIGGSLTSSSTISFSGVSGTSGYYSYTCAPSAALFGLIPVTTSPLYGRPLGSTCQNAISGSYSASSQKAYKACVTASSSASTVYWISRGDGYEEFRMPYLLSATLAIAFCQSMGGDLGTVKNSTHASNVYSALGGAYWVGYRCNGNTCAWLESSSTVSITSSVGNSLPNAINSNSRVTAQASATDTWLPFLCSRQIQSMSISIVGKCYISLACTANVIPSRTIQWFHLSSDTAQLVFDVSITGVATTITGVGFVSQQTSRSISFTAPGTSGTTSARIVQTSGGYNFFTSVGVSFTVLPLETVSFTGSTATATYFAQQSFTLSITKTSSDTVTVAAAASFSYITATSWTGNVGTLTALVTVAGSYSPTFAVTGQTFYNSATTPSSRSFVILAQSTLAISSPLDVNSILVNGDQFTITATPGSTISTIGGSLTITSTVSSGAPVSLVSGALTWATGASGAKVLTYQATNPGTSAVPVTIAASYSHPQFPGTSQSFTYTVRPKVAITMAGTGVYSTGSSGTVTITVPSIYVAGVSFVLTCAGATISPVSATPSSATFSPSTFVFTISSVRLVRIHRLHDYNFPNTMASIPFTVLGLEAPTFAPTTLISPQTIGAGYSQVVTLSLPSLPEGTTQTTGTVVYNASVFSILPASTFSWTGVDASLATKSITIVAVGLSSTTSPITVTWGTSTSLKLDRTTISVGSISTYQRALVNVTLSRITTYGQLPVTLTVNTSRAPQSSGLLLTCTVPDDFGGGTTSITIAVGATNATASFVPTQQSSVVGIFTCVLSTSNTELLQYDGNITALPCTVFPLRAASISCNDTRLFFASQNALACTVTVAAAAANLFAYSVANSLITFNVQQLALTSSNVASFIVTPVTSASVQDGTSTTIAWSLSDNTFVTPSLSIVVKQALTVSITLPQYIYIGTDTNASANAFVVQFTVSTQPDSPGIVGVVSLSLAGMSFNDTSVTFSSTSSTTQSVLCWGTVSKAYNFQFVVGGSSAFNALTTLVSRTLRPLVVVSSQTIATTNAYIFVGQNTSVTVSVSDVLPGATLTFVPVYYCDGVDVTSSSITASPASVAVSGSTTSASLTVTAVASCTSTTSAAVSLTLVTSSTIVNTSSSQNTTLLLYPKKSTTLAVQPYVYCGGSDNVQFSMTLAGAPNASTYTIRLSTSSTWLQLAGSVFVFTQATSILTLSTIATAPTCPTVATNAVITSTVDASDAVSEYSSPTTQTFTVQVRPQVRVVVPDLTSTAMFVGQTQQVTITLPETPNGGGLTFTATSNASTAATITPTSGLFQNGTTNLTQTFTISGLSPAFVGFSLVWSGSAPQYLPHPSKLWSMEVVALGVVSVSTTPPTSLFSGASAVPIVISTTRIPQPTFVVSVTITPNNATIATASPSTIQWDSTSTTLTAATNILPLTAGTVTFTLTLIAPLGQFNQTLNIVTFSIVVVNDRTIVWTVPSFIYVGAANAVQSNIVINKLPPAGQTLSLSSSVPAAQASGLVVSSISVFSSSTSTSQEVQIQGLAATDNVKLTLINTTVLVLYDVPTPVYTTIRALEVVSFSGLVQAMYVGQTVNFLVTVSRLPTCAGGVLIISPTSNLVSSAVFSTAQLTFSSTDQVKTQQVAVTAVAATLASFPASLTFPFSGSCTTIYTTVSAVSLQVYNTETVTLSLPSTNLDATSYFIYQGDFLQLNISLGTPSIYHTQTVVLLLAFQGASGFLSLSSTTVSLAAGVNRTSVNVTALQPTGSPITLTVTVQSGADVFATTNSLSVRVLARIPISVTFSQSPLQFFVQGVPTTATIQLSGSTALVGDVNVTLSYGPEVAFGFYVFAANSPATSATISINATLLSSAKQLNVSLLGSGAKAYVASVSTWSNVRVQPQRFVLLSGPSSLFLGTANAKTITFSLSPATTDLTNDQVTVTLTSPQQASWGSASVVLSTSVPTATVVFTGTLSGDVSIASYCTVASTSSQYTATVSATPTTITVLPLQKLNVTGFTSVLFNGDSSTFTVELTSTPLSGSLTVVPSLSGVSSSTYVFTPSSFTLDGVNTWSASVTITVSAVFTATMLLTTSNSLEYDSNGASLALQVNSANQIAIFGLPSTVYVGTANSVSFQLSIHAYPSGSSQTTKVAFQYDVQGKFAITPASVSFNSTNPTTQTVLLVGSSPVTNAQLRFTVTDPTAYFDAIQSQVLTVLALETISATISQTLLYVGQATLITVTFSSAPVNGLTLTMFLQQPRTDNQNAYVVLPTTAYTVSPAASIVVIGTTTVTFTITALQPGYNPHLTFSVLKNTESVRYDTSSLPTFDARFVALRTIMVAAPATLYVGLLSTATVTFSVTPDTGSYVAMTASTTSSTLTLATTAVTFNAGDLTKTFSVVPSTLGAYSVIFSVNPSTNNVAYVKQSSPSTWAFNVQNPAVVTLTGKPATLYVGSSNSFYLTISGFGTMSTGETLYINLTCTSPSVTIFPTQVEVGSMTPSFLLYSTSVTTTVCNMTLRSSINRFVLDPVFLGTGAGLSLSFLPLKSSTLAAPSTTTPYVNQWITLAVTIASLPAVGSSLIAKLVYTGSAANVALSPPISWTSQSPSLTQSLSFQGLSPTDANAISVALSNDNTYAALTTSYSIQFLAYVLIDVTPPLQAFVGQRMPILFYPEQVKIFTLTITFSIPGAVSPYITDSSGNPVAGATSNWVVSDSVRQKTAYLQCNVAGDVGVYFTVGGTDAAAFATPTSIVVRCLPVTTVLVNAPANDMVLYYSTAFFSEIAVQILYRPPVGTLIVTPTVVCAQAPSKIVSVEPAVLYFNSSYALQQTIIVNSVAIGGPCDLTFPLTGNTSGYVGNRKFTVTVKPLINISVSNIPSKVYVGASNQVTMSFALDSSAVIPLQYPVTVQLATSAIGQLCVAVSPTALYWAALSSTETLVKTVTVTASCSTSAIQSISATVSAAPNIYKNIVPNAITFSALPLVDVLVTSIPAGQRNFILYVGGVTITLAVAPGDALTSSETMSVVAAYQGSQGSISQLSTVWLPSSTFTTTKQMILTPVSVSPNAVLQFQVTGPPRFNILSPGSWTLQVVGKATVRLTIPTPMITGNDYSVIFTLGSLLDTTEAIVVTPIWYGSSSAFFDRGDAHLVRLLVLPRGAINFQAGYRLVIQVTGSSRFETIAFDGIVVINEANRIISTSLPTQLMKGQTYYLGINIGVLPTNGNTVTVSTSTILGPECITFPNGSTFVFTSTDPNAPTVQTVVVQVTKINCAAANLPFEVNPSSDVTFSRTVAPRVFRTVPAGYVSFDWPTMAYIGSQNAVSGLVLLIQSIDTETSTVSANLSSVGATMTSGTSAFFSYGSAPSVSMGFYHTRAETIGFSFSIYLDGSTTPVATMTQSTQFLALMTLTTSFASSGTVLYTGIVNALTFTVTLNTPMVQTDNNAPRRIRLTVVTNSTTHNSVMVQPQYMEWAVGYSQQQFVYLIGANTLDPYVQFSFQVSGTGSTYVSTIPSSFVLPVSAPLLVTYSALPADMYVGNPVTMTILMPQLTDALKQTLQNTNQAITVGLTVIGDADSLVISPASVTWAVGVNYSSPRFITITGLYASSSPKILTPTILVGPTWMAVKANTAGTTMNNLRSLTISPSATSYSWYTMQDHTIYYSPATVTFHKCNTTYDTALVVSIYPGYIVVSTRTLTRVVSFECFVNDTSYQNPPRTTVTILARKTMAFSPMTLYTYVGVANTFSVTVDPLPSTVLVMSPNLNFTADYFSMSPDALSYGPSSDKILQWSVTGKITSPLLTMAIVVQYTLDEFVDYSHLAVQLQVLPFLTVSIVSVNLVLNTSGPTLWYQAATGTTSYNVVELRFSIPRVTVFDSILIAPNLAEDTNGALRFCSSSQGCTTTTASDYTTSKPIVFDTTTTQRSVYVYATTAALRTLRFDVTNDANCIDYGGNASLVVGTINFQQLETLVVDTSAMKSIVYLGVNNSQQLRLQPTNVPLGSSSAEIVLSLPGNLVGTVLSSGTGFSSSDRGNGQYTLSWTGTAMQVYFLITGIARSTGLVTISLSWRSKPTNFDSLSQSTISVRVNPPISFAVTVPQTSGTVTLSTAATTQLALYVGSTNQITPSISTTVFPVLATDMLTILITSSDPTLLSISPSIINLATSTNNGAKSVSTQIYANPLRQGQQSAAVTVKFHVKDSTTPPEFNRTEYTLDLRIQQLQVLNSSLSTTSPTILAIGAENAVTFTLQPLVDVTLSLNALVTCSDVSFTPVDALSWVNSSDPKRLRISATSATGLSVGRCIIVTRTLAGGDQNIFAQPPFNATIYSLAKPQVVSPAQSLIPLATSVSTTGYNITLTLSGSYFTFADTSLASLLANGGITISSDMSIDEEPASFSALISAQLRGGAAFVTMALSGDKRTMTLQFGPSTVFQSSTLEQVVVTVGRLAIAQQVSVDTTAATTSFQVRGVKSQLLGNTGGFIGSGTSAASIIGSIVSMTSAQQANRLQTISQAFVCPNQDWREQQDNFNWNDQLIPLSFGSNEDLGGFAAVGISDLMVIAACMVLHLCVAWCVYEHRRKGSYADKSFAAALAKVRFPSFLLLPVMFFYQTMIGSGLTTIMYSPRLWFRLIGAFTLVVFGFGIPIAAYTVIGPGFRAEYVTEEEERRRQAKKRYLHHLRTIMGKDAEFTPQQEKLAFGEKDQPVAVNKEGDVPAADTAHASATVVGPGSPGSPSGHASVKERDDLEAFVEPEKKKRSAFGRFMLLFKPTGEWVCEEDPYWIQRYEMFFGEYRGGRHRYLAIDLILTFLLGVVDGIQPISITQCLGRTSAYVVLFGIQFILIVLLRPYRSKFGNMFFILAYFLQFLSMVFVAVAVYRNDPSWGGVDVAVNALVIFGSVLYVKTFLDFLQSLNENFELEKFFEEREDLSPKQIQGKRAEEQVVRNFEAEITTKMIRKQQEMARANIGFLLSGTPQHDGRTLEQIEKDMLDEEQEMQPYDPRKYLAKYRGPDGGEADSDEEDILAEHERSATRSLPRVEVQTTRMTAAHFYDPIEKRLRPVKRLDDRFEKLLAAAKERQQRETAATAGVSNLQNSTRSSSATGAQATPQGMRAPPPVFDDSFL